MMTCFNTSVYLCSRWSAIVFIISGSLIDLKLKVMLLKFEFAVLVLLSFFGTHSQIPKKKYISKLNTNGIKSLNLAILTDIFNPQNPAINSIQVNANLFESFASRETIILSGIVNMIKNVCTLFVEFDKNVFQKFWLEDIFNSPKMEKISVSQYHT